MGARVIGVDVAKHALHAFLTADHESGGRHQVRVGQLDALLPAPTKE